MKKSKKDMPVWLVQQNDFDAAFLYGLLRMVNGTSKAFNTCLRKSVINMI
jgi:hypothetical protein